jgi:hypothetical protein
VGGAFGVQDEEAIDDVVFEGLELGFFGRGAGLSTRMS